MKFFFSILLIMLIYASASADTLTLRMDTIYGINGNQVEIGITADGFTNLAVLEGTIQWEAAGLQFIEVKDFGVDKLGSDNFGQPNGTDDRITFSWTEAEPDGQSVDDGTIIFKLVFEVLGAPGDSSFVAFADEPLDVGAADNMLEEVPVIEHDGLVVIVADLSVAAMVTDVTCFGGNDGSIELIAMGGLGNYNYLWNTDSDSSAIDQLTAGTYAFTLTDRDTDMEIIDSINLISPEEIIIDLVEITGDEDTLGSFSIDVSGGIPPYTTLINEGEVEESENLPNGTYYVEVTDQFGCSQVDSIEINIEQTSSLHHIEIGKISVFPNPSKGVFEVKIDNKSATLNENWQIYDRLGRQLISGVVKTNQKRIRINLEHYSAGVYYLKFGTTTIPVILVE